MRWSVLAATLLLSSACAPRSAPPAPAAGRVGAGVARAECLPADRLPADLRAKSEDMLLKALDAVLARHAEFFAPLGFTRGSHPMEVLTAIEWSDRAPRWRGQGYLYGYPDYAVDFFVQAGEAEARTGQFVPRDPVRVPTFGTTLERSNFVWTAAKGHTENEQDRALTTRAARILAAYTERRARYIGPGKPGAFALLRDWYCGDGNGPCSPQNAR